VLSFLRHGNGTVPGLETLAAGGGMFSIRGCRFLSVMIFTPAVQPFGADGPIDFAGDIAVIKTLLGELLDFDTSSDSVDWVETITYRRGQQHWRGNPDGPALSSPNPPSWYQPPDGLVSWLYTPGNRSVVAPGERAHWPRCQVHFDGRLVGDWRLAK